VPVDYLLDTNVLLRALVAANPSRTVARHAIRALLRSGADLCVAPQNLVEFWSVSTRPAKDNGLGKTVAATDRYCRFIESFLAVLPETTAIFAEWRSLVVAHEVHGKQVYDARLVATMKAHAIGRILTFNVQDFTRYRDVGVEAVHPEMV
jgi:predicted nucleic acid-binding protein